MPVTEEKASYTFLGGVGAVITAKKVDGGRERDENRLGHFFDGKLLARHSPGKGRLRQVG